LSLVEHNLNAANESEQFSGPFRKITMQHKTTHTTNMKYTGRFHSFSFWFRCWFPFAFATDSSEYLSVRVSRYALVFVVALRWLSCKFVARFWCKSACHVARHTHSDTKNYTSDVITCCRCCRYTQIYPHADTNADL